MVTARTAAAQQPGLLDVPGAARWLSIGASTVRKFVREGELPVIQFGDLLRFHVDDLEAFAAAHRTTAKAPRAPRATNGTPSAPSPTGSGRRAVPPKGTPRKSSTRRTK